MLAFQVFTMPRIQFLAEFSEIPSVRDGLRSPSESILDMLPKNSRGRSHRGRKTPFLLRRLGMARGVMCMHLR